MRDEIECLGGENGTVIIYLKQVTETIYIDEKGKQEKWMNIEEVAGRKRRRKRMSEGKLGN